MRGAKMADKRGFNAQMAEETMQICERGSYECPQLYTTIDVAPLQRAAYEGSVCYQPDAHIQCTAAAKPHRTPCLSVLNASCVQVAQALVQSGHRTMVLNFASARNPGGGFLRGASAQEECIARSSGLYPCLCKHQGEFYQQHGGRSKGAASDMLYSDRMIFTPSVPFIRGHDNQLLSEPFVTDVITAAAPNAHEFLKRSANSSASRKACHVLEHRIQRVVALAAARGCEALVLGAWGCGVFGNDTAQVAKSFSQAIARNAAAGFKEVAFAVLDRPGGLTISAFEKQFGKCSADFYDRLRQAAPRPSPPVTVAAAAAEADEHTATPAESPLCGVQPKRRGRRDRARGKGRNGKCSGDAADGDRFVLEKCEGSTVTLQSTVDGASCVMDSDPFSAAVYA